MSTGSVAPFLLAGAVTIAATATAQTVALPASGDVVLVTNLAATPAYVSLTSLAAIGGSNSAVIGAGQRRALACTPYVTTASAILTAGTGNVVFEAGTGTVFG